MDIFEVYPRDFDSLEPAMRTKALETVQELIEQEGMSEKQAVILAIAKAEEWFYDLEGDLEVD